MEYLEVLNQVKVLIGQTSEGSSAFLPTEYVKAIQWAQEKTAEFLGLTYLEAVTGVTGATSATGDTVASVVMPLDAIKINRVLIWNAGDNIEETIKAPSPPVPPEPSYTITVAPSNTTLVFLGDVQTPSPLVFTVTITRLNGHTSPIDVSIPNMHSDGWTCDINGVSMTWAIPEGDPITTYSAPDLFYINMNGTPQGWAQVIANFPTVLSGIDGDMLAVQSNPFSIVSP